MKYLLWHLLAGTRGGESRIKIIHELMKKPMNANQLTTNLKMDYKTIRHHLKALINNRLVDSSHKEKYGSVYFLSTLFEANLNTFKEIWEKINKGKKQ